MAEPTYEEWRNMGVTAQAPSPYNIGGNLDFGGAPDFSQGGYQQAYNNALSLNKQNYQNILSGYQGLNANIDETIAGVGAAQAQQIQDQYVGESGKQAQGLISRGLGNTTVANSIQRGLMADKQKADIQLAGQMANLRAGYRSQGGNKQLDFMNSVMAKYPDAGMYLELQRMQGAASEAERNRQRGIGTAATGLGGGGVRVTNPGDNMGVGARMRAAAAPYTGAGVSPGGFRGGYAPQRPADAVYRAITGGQDMNAFVMDFTGGGYNSLSGSGQFSGGARPDDTQFGDWQPPTGPASWGGEDYSGQSLYGNGWFGGGTQGYSPLGQMESGQGGMDDDGVDFSNFDYDSMGEYGTDWEWDLWD